MPPEDIDDLFREKLDGHPTPPSADLWARLQAIPPPEAPNAERLDRLFQAGLTAHATPPGRELWERLEDEHLRKHTRRPAVGWSWAVAAVVALLLVAGGAGLWRGVRPGATPASGVAQRSAQPTNKVAGLSRRVASIPASPLVAPAAPNEVVIAATMAGAPKLNAADASPRKTHSPLVAQATRLPGVASNASRAQAGTYGILPRRRQGLRTLPKAGTNATALLARMAARAKALPTQARPAAADEQSRAIGQAPVVATSPLPQPATEIVPARLVPAPGLTNADGLITVDVRNGDAPVSRPAKRVDAALASLDEAPAERRRLGARLLQQAGHLARGERVNLAEAVGLPESLTLRATVAGRRLSKSIQL